MAEADIKREVAKWRRGVEDGSIGGGGGGPTGLPTGYLTGLETAINSGSPLTDIDFGIGACRSSDDNEDIRLTSSLTKELDNVWAAGTGAGGRASAVSLTADTWYHMFVITDGTTVDAGFDTSLSATNLLADSGYTQFRRIGSILTDSSSEIIPYTQLGSRFLWDDAITDVDNLAVSTTGALAVVSVPVDLEVVALVNFVGFHTASRQFLLTSPQQDNIAAGSANHTVRVNSNSRFGSTEIEIKTDSSSQLRHRADGGGGASIWILTRGWVDPRAEFQSGGAGQVSRATSSEYCPGYTFTFVDTDTWRITGINAENLFNVGRRLKFIDGGSTYFGTVTAVDFGITSAGDTTIDMSMESGDVLTNSITEVCLVTGATAWSPIVDDPFGGTPVLDIATGQIGGQQWWVIIGTGGRLATSTDGGLNWTIRSTGTVVTLQAIAYDPDNEYFFCGGDDGVVLYSSNGTTWTLDTASLPAASNSNTGDVVGAAYIADQQLWSLMYEDSAPNKRPINSSDQGSTWVEGTGALGNPDPRRYRKRGSSGNPNDVVQGLTDDVWRCDPNTGSWSQVESNVGDTVTALESEFLSSTYILYIGLENGNIQRRRPTAIRTDDVTFTAAIRMIVYSALHDRWVAVGDSQMVGYLDQSAADADDAWTFVASGFGPTVNINCVAFNETDGVFVAGGQDGSICRSSNGTN